MSLLLSYGKIMQLRASKAQFPQPAVSQPTAARHSMPSPPEQQQKVQANAPQLNPSASSFVPEAAGVGADEGLIQDEGGCKPSI